MLEGVAYTARNDEELSQELRLVLPEIDDEERADILVGLRAFRAANPTRHSPANPEYASLISHGSGFNAFKAAWTADQIGGYLVARGARDREVFRMVSRGDKSTDSVDTLATAFASAELPMLNNVTLTTALELRTSGRLAAFRTFLQDTCTATSEPDADLTAPERDRRLVDRLKSEHEGAKGEWRSIYRDLGFKGLTSLAAAPGIASIIEAGVVPAAAAVASWLHKSWSGSARTFRRRPAGALRPPHRGNRRPRRTSPCGCVPWRRWHSVREGQPVLDS